MTEFLINKNAKCAPNSPYSPDVAPCDFYLFPHRKKEAKRRRFQTELDGVKAFEAILKRFSKNGFRHVFEQWQPLG